MIVRRTLKMRKQLVISNGIRFPEKRRGAHARSAARQSPDILTLVLPAEPPTLEMRCRDERHSRKKSKTSNCGHRPFRGTCRGNRPRNGDSGGNQFPHQCSCLAYGRCGRRKRKSVCSHAGSAQTLEAAKDAASPEKLAEIDDDIAAFQEIYDMVVTEAAKRREPLPAMQANVDAAQAKYDEAHNRTSGLQAELNKAIDDGASNETIKQLQSEIMSAERREKSAYRTKCVSR